MLEKEGYIWHSDPDVICIPTSSDIDEDGRLEMKDNTALEAKETDNNVPYYFARHIINRGNTPCLFMRDTKPHFCSLPVKFGGEGDFNIELIVQSVKLMLGIVNHYNFTEIVLPRPGCGKGSFLDWKSEVKPLIEPLLDDRFTVYDSKIPSRSRMLEKPGIIWKSNADVICIPTNGAINSITNRLMMEEHGVGYEAEEFGLDLNSDFARHVEMKGNTPCLLLRNINPNFCSMPIRHGYREKPDLALIERSIKQIVNIMDTSKWLKTIALPRPGCEYEELDWENEVKPVIGPLLDERFMIYYPGRIKK